VGAEVQRTLRRVLFVGRGLAWFAVRAATLGWSHSGAITSKTRGNRTAKGRCFALSFYYVVAEATTYKASRVAGWITYMRTPDREPKQEFPGTAGGTLRLNPTLQKPNQSSTRKN
jgi:hypothetical protein